MTDISILFARDPLSLSDEDHRAIVAKFRESRHLFNSGVKAPKKLTKAEEETKSLGLNLTLDI